MCRCENCPGKESLREYLYSSIELNFDSEIIFQQWMGTDRTTLLSDSASIHDLIDMISNSIDKLTCHSYIAKAQSSHLKLRKENVDENTIIVSVDFSENFTFIIQDEIQSYHWCKEQATLHPVVMYYKENGTVKHKSFCVISDIELHHDVSMVYEIQAVFLTYLKACHPKVSKVEYFSDGSAAQYKNKYNLVNLGMHKRDFGFDAEWNFFANAHGKSPCDGIGGTVKRCRAIESLKRINKAQILNVKDMFHFCKQHFSSLSFFYISKNEIDEVRYLLQRRYARVKRIPGIRSCHRFKPISSSILEIMRTSD